MFGFFSKKLTEYSNHYIDWSRSAVFLRSGNHRYSKDELVVRGGIAAITAVSAFLGAYFNDEKKTQRSDLTVALAAGLLGLTLAHTLVVYPLVKKRYEMKRDCNQLLKEIELKMNQLKPALKDKDRQAIQSVSEGIINLSLSNEKNANASQTWGRRKQLLAKVSEALGSESFDAEFWQGASNAIIEKLSGEANLLSRKRLC